MDQQKSSRVALFSETFSAFLIILATQNVLVIYFLMSLKIIGFYKLLDSIIVAILLIYKVLAIGVDVNHVVRSHENDIC